MPFRRLLPSALLACAIIGASTVLTSPTADAHGVRPVTVMSFNIHHAAGTDEALDLDRIATVIKESRADVIGLQEVDRHYSERSDWADQPVELAQRLGFYVAFGANIDEDPPEGSDDRIQYGTAVLSRFPIKSSENIPLYNTDDREPRGLLHAEIDLGRQSLDFYSTHLDASSQPHRMEQAKQIVDLVDADGSSVLVGDFNAEPDAPEIGILDDSFTDAWTAAGRGDGSTYPTEEPAKRIDMIYTGDQVKPVRTRVLDRTPEASDHLPVVSNTLIGR